MYLMSDVMGKNCLKQNGFIIIWKTFQIIHPDANCYY